MSIWPRRVIASCEIVGGVAGPISVVTELVQVGFRPDAVVMSGYVVGIFLLSLYAGIMLWRDRRAGYLASVIVQLIQFPKLQLAQFGFSMSFGFDFMVLSVMHPDGLRGFVVSFPLFAHHSAFLGPRPGAPVVGGISIMSCITLWLLLTHSRIDTSGERGRPSAEPEKVFQPAADAVEAFKELQEPLKRAKEAPTRTPSGLPRYPE